MLCSVVLASAVQQCESVIIIHISLPSVPPLQAITEHKVRLPVLYGNFPPATYLTHDSVYMSVLLSQFVPPSPPTTVSTSLFSVSASPFLPCK